MSSHILVLIAVLPPLALDTFVLAATLGLAGLPRERHLSTSLVLAAFEAGMPLVGVAIGRGLGQAVGDVATIAGAVALAVVGIVLLRSDEDDEEEHARLLARAHGWAVVQLGLAVSIDELGIGVGLGLLRVPLGAAVALLGVQAFVAARLGLWLGGRVSEELREGAERVAGVILIAIAIALAVLELTGVSTL
jgi:manganese efflux pump family protein